MSFLSHMIQSRVIPPTIRRKIFSLLHSSMLNEAHNPHILHAFQFNSSVAKTNHTCCALSVGSDWHRGRVFLPTPSILYDLSICAIQRWLIANKMQMPASSHVSVLVYIFEAWQFMIELIMYKQIFRCCRSDSPVKSMALSSLFAKLLWAYK